MNTLEQLLASDTLKPHDKKPHGVPSSYDWQDGPVIHHIEPPAGYDYFNPWGQVYWPEDATNFNNYGCRVEIRDLQSWLLRRDTLVWEFAYPSLPSLTGSWYPEDFQGSPVGATINRDRPGSIMSYVATGKLFHFYPNTARVHIDPENVVGVAVTCRARLTLIGTPDGVHQPEWYVNVGADYWPDATSGDAVRGVGQGRLKLLEPTWRVFGFTTAPAVPLNQTSSDEWR